MIHNQCNNFQQYGDFIIAAGILVGAWPFGTTVLVLELYGAESLTQVYGAIHTFLQENKSAVGDHWVYITVFVSNDVLSVT